MGLGQWCHLWFARFSVNGGKSRAGSSETVRTFGRMFRASRRQSHPSKMEDTDSCTAPAWTGPPWRTAPNASPVIEENARAAPSRDGARRPRRAEEPEWTSASCGVFAVRVRRLRGFASHQHVQD
jgi:hypothetical protein